MGAKSVLTMGGGSGTCEPPGATLQRAVPLSSLHCVFPAQTSFSALASASTPRKCLLFFSPPAIQQNVSSLGARTMCILCTTLFPPPSTVLGI